MLSKQFFQKLKKDYENQESERKKIIEFSASVLHDSKRVIFATHRKDYKKAAESLKAIEKTLTAYQKQFSFSRLTKEGSYRAGAEEYVEARIFYNVARGEKIDRIPKIKIDHESYLAGICDVTGELVRRAVNLTSEGSLEETYMSKSLIQEIMEELAEFNMTGYLRTKYDQARHNLRKIEQIAYEVKLRQ